MSSKLDSSKRVKTQKDGRGKGVRTSLYTAHFIQGSEKDRQNKQSESVARCVVSGSSQGSKQSEPQRVYVGKERNKCVWVERIFRASQNLIQVCAPCVTFLLHIPLFDPISDQ